MASVMEKLLYPPSPSPIYIFVVVFIFRNAATKAATKSRRVVTPALKFGYVKLGLIKIALDLLKSNDSPVLSKAQKKIDGAGLLHRYLICSQLR